MVAVVPSRCRLSTDCEVDSERCAIVRTVASGGDHTKMLTVCRVKNLQTSASFGQVMSLLVASYRLQSKTTPSEISLALFTIRTHTKIGILPAHTESPNAIVTLIWKLWRSDEIYVI